MKPFVKVTTYKGRIIIQTLISEDHPDWIPIGPGKFGCVLINTKAHLAISNEAIALLSTIPKGRDAIGEIDWFDSVKGKCLAWFGHPNRIIDPALAKTARDSSSFPLDCTIIDNETDPDVIKILDETTMV